MIRVAALWLCATVVIAQTAAPAPQTPPSGVTETRQVFDPASGRFVDPPQSKPADTTTFRVTGTIRDRDTKLPIAGARVILQTGRYAAFADSAIGRPGVRVTVSGPDGTFSFDAVDSGMHSFMAIAEGWIGEDSDLFVSIRGNKTVELSLVRSAAISGRLVDADTHKPVAGIEVTATRVEWSSGVLVDASGSWKSVASNGDGDFRFDKLPPGEYTLEMVASDAEETLAVAKQDRNASGKPNGEEEITGYRRQWWPGSFDDDRTFTLRSGTDFSPGNIPISRLPMYRISGEVKPVDCAGAGAMKIELSQRYGNGGTSRGDDLTIPCGIGYTIGNLSPGQYDLEATGTKGGGAVRLRASGKVTIADRDVSQDLTLAPALIMTGRVELPDGFPRDFKGLSLWIRYVEGSGAGGGIAPIADDRTFAVNADGARVFQLTAGQLPPPYYLAEVKYAGQTAPDGMVTVNPLSMAQTIEARISAKSAGITGTVREKDDPAAGAVVLLVPWPVRWSGSFPIFCQTFAGEDGSFSIGQLPPGRYHLLGVDSDTWNTELQKAGVLAALAAEGTEVVVVEGQTGNATLELKRVAGTP